MRSQVQWLTGSVAPCAAELYPAFTCLRGDTINHYSKDYSIISITPVLQSTGDG